MSSSAPPSEALSSAKQKLFELMLERERASQRVASERIPRVDRSRPLPLSFAQQRLWFLDRLEPGSHAYNLPLIVRLRGDLDVAVLQRSLDELIRRHEVLRTRFGLRDGQPVQIVDAELHLPLRQIDLRQVDDTLDPEDIAAADNRLPYDLATGPLLRATLVRTDETDHLFILNVHHIVSDGWSLGVLVREIGGLYQAFAADQPVPFQELPIQYGDFAVWQREMLAGEVFGQQLDYWQRLLASAPAVLELPADNPRPPVQSISGRTLTFALPNSASTGVRALAHAEEATLFTALLTVFEVLLSRYSGQNDLLVGTPVANRNRVQLEGLIGFFVNTLVLRTEIADDPSFRGLLQQVRRSVVGALQHQDIPFERLVEELQPQRDVSRSPLFQVMFALQNKPDLDQEFAGVRLTPVEIDPQTSKFDLTLTLEETADGLLGKLEYPLALFDPSTADRMAKHFETLLLGVVEDPDRRLAELPLLASSERRQIEQWNATAVDYPRRQTVHGLFEARVAAHPERIALTFGQQALTYRELDRRAERLAGMLEALGAGTERPIGVELERSAAMVVAVLAVLKTGAAFLPLDP
ncbi:MAG: condensation domain-containing protein, partial [Acidobacteriota bacterium]